MSHRTVYNTSIRFKSITRSSAVRKAEREVAAKIQGIISANEELSIVQALR